MVALTAARKIEHLNYYLDNLKEETVLIDELGRDLVAAVVDYIGHDNFFRVHKDIKVGSNYRSVPALRDKAKLRAFIEENAMLIAIWFGKRTQNAGGMVAAEVIYKQIDNDTLPHCPYPLSEVRAVIHNADDEGVEITADKTKEIQEWLGGFVLARDIDGIANQGSLIILGVAKAAYPWQTVRKTIFNHMTDVPDYDEFCSDLMKTMVFLITDTFTNYLKKNSWKDPAIDPNASIPF